MDVGLWIGLGLCGLGLLIFGGIYYRMELEFNYRYCSRCGQYMEPQPFNNRVLHKLLGFSRYCTSLTCTLGKNTHILQRKLFNAFFIILFVWIPFYFIYFRDAVIAEYPKSIIYSDLIQLCFVGLMALFARWLYTQYHNNQTSLNLEVL